MSIPPRLKELHPELTRWRRDLHQHPQTAFEETYASEFISNRLTEMGIPISRGLAKTGVVGSIVGRHHAKCDTQAIGLRADIDALDILEATGLPYASIYPGKMHACGHDGHTTMLLGAAKYLSETRNFAGTVHVIFQPADKRNQTIPVVILGRMFTRMVETKLFERVIELAVVTRRARRIKIVRVGSASALMWHHMIRHNLEGMHYPVLLGVGSLRSELIRSDSSLKGSENFFG